MPGSDLSQSVERCVAEAGIGPDVPLVAAVRIAGRTGRYHAPVPAAPERCINHGSLLYAASLAKQFAGVCFALAVRDGAVSPDDALACWFPDLPGWAACVKLQHLLWHMGALPEDVPLLTRMRDGGDASRTSPGMLSALHGFAELDEIPGSSYRYSDMGYVCLARIVELASGESLPSFARRRVFTPLGMANTCFWPGPHSVPAGAVSVEDEPVAGQPFSLGDGGLWTTVDDLLRWNDAMNRDQLGVAELVQQTGVLNSGASSEYAWGIRRIEINGYTGWSHGGSWPGIFAKSVRLPGLDASFVAFTLDTDIAPILRLTDLALDLIVDATPD